jgi:HK97 family phage major capsid protein
MRRLTENPSGTGGDLSDEQATKFDDLKAQLERTEANIQRQQAVDDAERRMAAPAIISGNGRDGAYEQRAHEFSLVRAINAALGEQVDNGFEREISAEVRRRAGRPFMGIAVPDEVFLERRTILVGQGGSPANAGETLYPTTHRPDLFIDRLRSALVVQRLGATVLDGLVGDVEIPRQTGSSTAQHVAEDGALSETDAAFDDVQLSPKTVGAVTSYSRRALINAAPSIEQVLRRDLAAVIANEIDAKALLGNGTSNTPTGVVATMGVTEATLATPTWAQVLAFAATIQAADADFGDLAWAMNPRAVAKLRSVSKVTSDVGAGFLMDSPDMMAGYRVATTSALPGTAATSPDTKCTVIFGAWSQLIVGYWSGIDLLTNPFDGTAYLRGRVLLRAMRDYDVAVRHVESFAFADDLPVA